MSWIYDILKMILLLIAPFAILIRGASYIHDTYAYPASLSLILATIAIVLLIYFSIFYGKLTGRIGSFNAVKRRALIAFLAVAVYAVHGIMFFSNSNLKSKSLSTEMSSLHPILRLSLSTLVYLDKDLIITDASRQPEDYTLMGLPRKRTSLHYKQKSSNYVHAVDLRTKGNYELKNKLVQAYFFLMGFNTLRHSGTDDHLHVSLKSHDYPNAR